MYYFLVYLHKRYGDNGNILFKVQRGFWSRDTIVQWTLFPIHTWWELLGHCGKRSKKKTDLHADATLDEEHAERETDECGFDEYFKVFTTIEIWYSIIQ